MGIFKKDQDGMDCEEDEQGNLMCRKFVTKGNVKAATGSEATISTDPKTCKSFFSGHFSVLEEDEADFERIAKKREAACKGGLQWVG